MDQVRVRGIAADDRDSVAAFLHEHLNPRVSAARWQAILDTPWPSPSGNHGFLLERAGAVLGVYVAVYSQRVVSGAVRKICNLAAFCVLDEYRAHGLRLLQRLLAQEGVEFTDLSPSGNVVRLNERLGFVRLDTSGYLALNFPAPGGSGVELSDRPDDFDAWLPAELAQVCRDHRGAAAVRQVALRSGDRICYVVFRRERRKGLPLFACILHVAGDRGLLATGWPVLRRHLALRHRLPFTIMEHRVCAHRPGFAVPIEGRPRMYRSSSLHDDDIDYLYSELTLVEW